MESKCLSVHRLRNTKIAPRIEQRLLKNRIAINQCKRKSTTIKVFEYRNNCPRLSPLLPTNVFALLKQNEKFETMARGFRLCILTMTREMLQKTVNGHLGILKDCLLLSTSGLIWYGRVFLPNGGKWVSNFQNGFWWQALQNSWEKKNGP